MANAALRRLNKIQKKLYDSMVPEAKTLASGINRDIYLYSKKFEASLPKIVKNTTFSALKNNIKSAQIVLFGDFHTHKQSQKEFRRVIDGFNSSKSERMVIALECFRQADQAWIDRYMQNSISRETLLSQTKFDKFWGFPPENYLPILDFAKENGISVYGINSRSAGRDSLLKRDEEMARNLFNISQEQPSCKIFCLVGEFHLADSSLPRYLANYGPDRLLRIVMNIDQYYFDSKSTYNPHETQYLRLADKFFCIMNAAPWLKWQSFMVWQEGRSFAKKNLPQEHDHELEYDIDSHFYTLARVLNEYLSLNLSEHQLTDFHIYYGLDPMVDAPRIQESQKYGSASIRSQLDDHHHVWLAGLKSLLITKIDTNTLAEAAGRSLYGLVHTPLNQNNSLPVFYEQVLETSFATICSKIINPQRKYANLSVMMQNLLNGETLWKEKIDPIDRLLKKHLQWVIKKHLKDDRHYQRPLRSIYQSDLVLHGKISHRLGQYWGSYLYRCLIDGHIDLETLLMIYFPPREKPQSAWDKYQKFFSVLFAQINGLKATGLQKIS